MIIVNITDNENTISQHFGHAQYYLVATVENGQIVGCELLPKLGYYQFASQTRVEEQPDQPHGMDPVLHDNHLYMAEALSDCEVLLCRGMGMGTYESMKTRGIQPIVTDIALIDNAVWAYVERKIADQVDLLH